MANLSPTSSPQSARHHGLPAVYFRQLAARRARCAGSTGPVRRVADPFRQRFWEFFDGTVTGRLFKTTAVEITAVDGGRRATDLCTFFPQQENRETPHHLQEVISISQASAGLLANVFEGVFQRELPTNLQLTKRLISLAAEPATSVHRRRPSRYPSRAVEILLAHTTDRWVTGRSRYSLTMVVNTLLGKRRVILYLGARGKNSFIVNRVTYADRSSTRSLLVNLDLHVPEAVHCLLRRSGRLAAPSLRASLLLMFPPLGLRPLADARLTVLHLSHSQGPHFWNSAIIPHLDNSLEVTHDPLAVPTIHVAPRSAPPRTNNKIGGALCPDLQTFNMQQLDFSEVSCWGRARIDVGRKKSGRELSYSLRLRAFTRAPPPWFTFVLAAVSPSMRLQGWRETRARGVAWGGPGIQSPFPLSGFLCSFFPSLTYLSSQISAAAVVCERRLSMSLPLVLEDVTVTPPHPAPSCVARRGMHQWSVASSDYESIPGRMCVLVELRTRVSLFGACRLSLPPAPTPYGHSCAVDFGTDAIATFNQHVDFAPEPT
ncbi:hypothetical protein K438DRAFT_1786397 [Mycena galopus ATCC 62051]|nr:hypothetical protein K438DRAFT_1786397 [Mycena galopus ATCC 62051]